MDIKPDRIIRTKRKTIALQITEEGKLIVKAPIDVDDKTIERIILKRKAWIERNIERIKRRDPKPSKREFVNGEGFLYLGRYYRLQIVENQEMPLKLEDRFFYLSKSALANAKEVFIKWYKEKAYEKISERVEFYARIAGFKYNKVNITDAEKRWGSCSQKGNLNFSWRLIMAPLRVIDYVVVHELCHLEIKNHSKAFWIKVKTLMPDYKDCDIWLKEFGYLLRL